MVVVVFLESFEQYVKGNKYQLERTLANGLYKRKICVPFTVYQKMLKEKEQKAKESAEKAEADKKAELLKKKETIKTEKMVSKKPVKAEKSIKK